MIHQRFYPHIQSHTYTHTETQNIPHEIEVEEDRNREYFKLISRT